MEQSDPARRSSDIYHADHGSQDSFSSGANLREHEEDPAGVMTRTHAGIPVAPLRAGGGDGAVSGWVDPPDPPQQAPQQPKIPLYKRRWFIITAIVVALLGIALLFILLFPVVRAIVQLVVKRTQIDVERATILNATNTTFDLHLEGNVTHTGIVSSTINFTEDVEVFWLTDPDNNSTGVKIGHMNPLAELHAHGKRAKIDQVQHFVIDDQEAFSEFSRFLITAPQFSWRLHSNNLRVQALKFPVSKGITFDKRVDLKGINNFNGNVVLLDFQLPRDNSAGGIDFVAVTQLNNESPFTLQLGTTVFDLIYDDLRLGSGTSTNTVVNAGLNNITLKGVLERVADRANLPKVSTLFTNYINSDVSPVFAQGKSTLQDDGSVITWLSEGLKSLKLEVPFKPFIPIVPIRSISIGDLSLSFSPDSPYTPGISSNTVNASLSLPFGFHLDIGQIQNDFNLTGGDGTPIAGLSTPLGASTSQINVLSETDTEGTINIVIANSSLTCPDPQHPAFSAFNAMLTNSTTANFLLVGNSSAVANLSIGEITLNPIKVNVSTSLLGLQGLRGTTQIQAVDVVGGTTEHINLNINVTIFNPSNLNLSLGDLTLQLSRDGANIGTALLPSLNLHEGNNSIQATSNFTANNSPEGIQTLNDFIGHRDVPLTISGFSGSTNIESLAEAFQTLDISVVLPGLQTNLLERANLTVLPTTGRGSNISHVTVALNNPFSTALRITRVASNVTFNGIALGTIDVITDFMAPPNSVTESPLLDFNMNFDPVALFTVTRALAVQGGIDTSPLDGITQLGNIPYSFITGEPPITTAAGPSLYTGFDLPTFIQNAFKNLQSDVQLITEVSIGDYLTMLQYTQPSVPTATDDTLNFILPVLAQPIIEGIITNAGLGLHTVMISSPQQDSFGTQLQGRVDGAGPFNAMISFPEGLDVSWRNNPLGNLQMPGIQVIGGSGADIDTSTTPFNVQDAGALGSFTETLLTEPSFDWDISGKNLIVKALGITVPGVPFNSKRVTLNGFNGLKDQGVTVHSFDLPGDIPNNGGISLNLEASTFNPSDVGIHLDTLAFDTFMRGSMIANVDASKINLPPRSPVNLSLAGRLMPQQGNPTGLKDVGDVFNNFIAGKSSPVSVHGSNAGNVTWLNQGIKALKVSTSLPTVGQQKLIDSITLSQVSLMFTKELPYEPDSSSSLTRASYHIPTGFHDDTPFGFGISIEKIDPQMTVSYNNQAFAQLDIRERDASDSQHNITISFDDVPFSGIDGANGTFEKFLADTTISDLQTLNLDGVANAQVHTSIGVLALSGLGFSVNTPIPGLQGLNSTPVSVRNVVVKQGFENFLLITADGMLFNPSNLTIGTGNVTFDLRFQGNPIGTAQVRNMTVQPGEKPQPIEVHYQPEGDAIPFGQMLLESFIQGIDVNTTIAGSRDSTDIQSLKPALSMIQFSDVTIPAFKNGTLIQSVTITFPLDIVDTGIAHTTFVLYNPFDVSINLLRVFASATFQNITLGFIPNVNTSDEPISAPGHSKITSRELDFKFDLRPEIIIPFLEQAAAQNNVDLGPLKDLLQFVLDNPDFKPPVKTSVDPSGATCVSGKQFNITDAILASLQNLTVDLAVDTSTKLDLFATDLAFAQKSIPAMTNRSALNLIGAVAGPVAQHLVDGSQLNFTTAIITNITNYGFDLFLKGSLTNTGPLDASIEFTEPLTVTWEGRQIAQLTLPPTPVCAVANEGIVDYETTAHVKIIHQDDFTEFAEFLLHNEEFEWTINTNKLRLRALETIFDDVALNKSISFKAFNNLPGVMIQNFQLPSDDPEGGIHIETDATIPSPAQVGIELGHVTFQTFFKEVLVGPLAADNLTLQPNSTTQTHLAGRIVPQTGDDLEVIGILFSEFLAGHNVTLQTRGDSVQPPGTDMPVTWLSAAFKTLSLDIVLPGQRFDVIKSIQLNDLQVIMDNADQAFAPLASSENTVAQYANPFGFSLQVTEAAQTLILGSKDVDAAQLDLAKAPANGGVSTGNTVDLDIKFENQTLRALDKAAFGQLFADVTLMSQVDVSLKGSANVTGRTAIGDVPITGIPINVTSSLKGLNSLDGTASLSNVSVAGSGGVNGNEFVVAPLLTALKNPSNVSLSTVDVSLPVIFQGTKIGRAVINDFNLVPGENDVPTEFHYEPDDANNTVAQSFLTKFIQTGDALDLLIDGDDQSSPFESLRPALSGLTLKTSLSGINQPNFITSIQTFITLDSLFTNLVTVEFQAHNPLDTDIVIEFVQGDGGVNGLIYAHFEHHFDNFLIKAGESAGSGAIPNVVLTQGALPALEIIPLGILDISAAATVRIGSTGGYEVPWLKLQQTAVPTAYNLTLGLLGGRLSLDDLLNKAKDIITHKNTTSSLSISQTASSVASASSLAANATAPASAEGTNSADGSGGVNGGVISSSATALVPEPTTDAQPENKQEGPAPATVAPPEASKAPEKLSPNSTDSDL